MTFLALPPAASNVWEVRGRRLPGEPLAYHGGPRQQRDKKKEDVENAALVAEAKDKQTHTDRRRRRLALHSEHKGDCSRK